MEKLHLFWYVPCHMEDGSFREIKVRRGDNPPDIEERLKKLHALVAWRTPKNETEPSKN